jgi:hypothetical protein
VDGSVLEIRPVPVRARDDVAYEVTLQLLRDGALFGQVGERCGWFLTTAAARLRAARTAGGGPPTSALEAGVRRWAARTGVDPDRTWEGMQRYLPRDRELLAFRSRDPDDLAAAASCGSRCAASAPGTARATAVAGGCWTTPRCWTPGATAGSASGRS